MAEIVFHRTSLAEQLVKGIMASAIGSASASGLFLAAPRRTGKSTFVREDLRPALQRVGATVIYVDLWANKQTDPGVAIVGAVRAELAKHEGIIARLARSAGMEKVAVGGIAFSLDRVGLGKEVSLSGALAALSDETKRPIVLLIDEAQHAITTDGGYDALFALKAARDELNSSEHHGLRIVATGSNRDKLAMLRNSKDQAFFGAPLIAFPTLGSDYIQWFCKGVGLAGPLDPDAVMKLFERAGFRPEILGAAADSLRFDLNLMAEDAGAAFARAVDKQIEEADMQTLRVINSLTPLQSAVLRVLAHDGEKYAPFETGTMKSYRTVLSLLAPDEEAAAEVSNIQAALGALQEKALIWKEKRGVYSLEESTTAELLRQHGLLDVCALQNSPRPS